MENTKTSKLGLYLVNCGIFKVKANKAKTSHYALKLTDGIWEYAPGAVNHLRPETKMTLAQAAHYGLKTGRCVVCQRLLTDEKSVVAGIGPVCAKNF